MTHSTLGREFLGEFLGTFLLVLFGCSSVAVAVIYGGHQGLFQVAMVWGIGVALAIYATRSLSGAHLNPAVTLGLTVIGKAPWAKVPHYLLAQFAGAFVAGAVVLGLFGSALRTYEQNKGIVRGTPESIRSAIMFGEYYPNPGASVQGASNTSTGVEISMLEAMAVEAFGTFLLMLIILILTDGSNRGAPNADLVPVMIGLTVTSIICVIAPLTQSGLNPARDFSPRLVAWLAGWGEAAFPREKIGAFTVYILAPIVGSIIASLAYQRVLKPAYEQA